MARLLLFMSFLSLALTSGVNGRVLGSLSEQNSTLISDGVQDGFNYELLSLDHPNRISKNECIHVYGFLPCADNVGGYVFQVFSFGCLLMIGEYFLSEGRSKLFLIFEVGFYGGIVFPLLRMFPRIVLILSTGLMGSPEIANSMVGNTVGVTVGYTVFALTIQWGACVIFGLSGSDRKGQQVEESTTPTQILRGTSRRQCRRKLLKSLVEASVEADPKNTKAAGIMLLTILPFILITFSEIFDSQSWKDLIRLITLLISASATLVYFTYSYFDKVDQEKSLDHARFELMSEVHKHLQTYAPKTLLRDGNLSEDSLKGLFEKLDANEDRKIQISELKNMRVEFEQLGKMKCNTDEFETTLLEYFDKDGDGQLNFNEFKEGISNWFEKYKFSFDNNENLFDEVGVLKEGQQREELFFKFFSKRTLRASMEVIVGMMMVMFLARPFMMNIELLSVSAGVPSFYVVFIVIPLSRNLKHALSAHFCRNKDKARITSDIFSEIYSDVTMNNLLGISCILVIVYARGFIWDYSTEVFIVVIVGFLVGIPAYVRSTYPFWICLLAIALYFVSLLLIYLHFSSLM